ncbi:MAG: DNA polymerase III subunit gamma/tau [Planctomycetota bacterium]
MSDSEAAMAPGSEEGRAGAPAYEVIARRYRPRFFEEVVGQEATAETLRQAILHERLAHAYLFCGPRGVGKTSMARIFARALQCPNAEDATPCDRCATCDRIFRGEDMDVVEMDGASHRGIDDVRELIQHVRYAPTSGPYRVFIIDEVHMLTREAFNALLKTLEEPPAHVKFVFATTEVEKIPSTVVSRCQRCDFAPVSPADIVRRLEQICAAEGATPETGLLDRVADLSRGGMRDSQSLLDQLLSFAGESPTLEDLDRITGRLSPEAIRRLTDLVEAGERSAVVRELISIEEKGSDPAVLLEQVVEELRGRLHRGVEGGWGNADIERNLIAQEILQEARLRVRQLGRPEIVVELALLRLSTVGDLVPIERWKEAAAGGRAEEMAPAPAAGGRPRERTAPAPARAPRAGGARMKEAPPPAPAPEASPTLERVLGCLNAISPSAAGLARDRLRIRPGKGDAIEVEIHLEPALEARLDGPTREAFQKAIEKDCGAPATLRLRRSATTASGDGGNGEGQGVAEVEDEGAGRAAAPGAAPPPRAGGDRPPPPIVERAREIFHGTIQGAPPQPPRR